jgi:hypothetical protein
MVFRMVPLHFKEGYDQNVFAQKKDKTVRETLSSPKYSKLSQKIIRNYSASLDQPVGDFLIQLKKENNPFYKEFLNQYGDNTYCIFSIDDPHFLDARGLYCYLVDEKIKYIGRCPDSFRKRINQGYGKIHPKNCYMDGQANNCHINFLIAHNMDRISLYICSLDDENEIEYLGKYLITKQKPEWNVSLQIE